MLGWRILRGERGRRLRSSSAGDAPVVECGVLR